MTTEDDFQHYLDEQINAHSVRIIFSDFLLEQGDIRWYGYRWLGQNEKYPRNERYSHWYYRLVLPINHNSDNLPYDILITNTIVEANKFYETQIIGRTRQAVEDLMALKLYEKYVERQALQAVFDNKHLEEDLWKLSLEILTVDLKTLSKI